MPNIKSAKKRVKVIAVKTAHNKAVKSNLKTVIKKAEFASQEHGCQKEIRSGPQNGCYRLRNNLCLTRLKGLSIWQSFLFYLWKEGTGCKLKRDKKIIIK